MLPKKMTDPHLADLRKTYSQRSLSETDVLPNAVQQFRRWLVILRRSDAQFEAQLRRCENPGGRHVACADRAGETRVR